MSSSTLDNPAAIGHPDVPPDDFQVTGSCETSLTSYSDDVTALNELEVEARRVKTGAGVVVQHRSWKTIEIFHSDPRNPGSSSPMQMANMLSSPPATPSPQKKRKFADLSLGQSLLTRPAKAQRTYYGIDIHRLLDDAKAEESIPKAATDLPTPPVEPHVLKKTSVLWTEKYRARKFTDLIGDERVHRAVMHWLKRWDQIVFPGLYRPKAKSKASAERSIDEKSHKKILLLTGPPGLGKTTLAHVCAKQAGYEVQEVNASDERSAAVVKGRIRDMVGTENVKGIDTKTVDGHVRKVGKPVCVIIDEVDGVVSGSGGGGEGGFVKALIDLVMLDQKNSSVLGTLQQAPIKKKQGDRFRLLRPVILICNDVYHPSLRPLRQSSMAEVIHVRKPPLQTLANRMQVIFDQEGVPCESDGVRRLCEATWGVSNRREDRCGSGAGEGDMRGIMVVGEWVAGKLRSMHDATGNARLTRRWVEEHVVHDLAHGGGAARGLGRGGPRDIVERVFQAGAGFPTNSATITPQHQTGNAGVKGVTEGVKRTATDRLRELIDTHGDTDRIVTDCFSSYPEHPFQDDTLLSKPAAASEWLHFHDSLSSAVFSSNEWELAPYLSTPVLGFHHLFASPTRAQYTASNQIDSNTGAGEAPTHPFLGTQASWAAHEALKHNEALIQTLQSSLSPNLSRTLCSTSDIATDLLPYILRMLSPNINPVVVGGSGNDKGTASVRKASEQVLIRRAVQAMLASSVRFERTRVSADEDGAGGAGWRHSQWIYRMEPSLDTLGLFETGGKGFGGTAMDGGKTPRYAVRQVLDQECRKEELRRAETARLARFKGAAIDTDHTESLVSTRGSSGTAETQTKTSKTVVKKDFFGRTIAVPMPNHGGSSRPGTSQGHVDARDSNQEERRVWVTFHEGFSNAVRKPITLAELMKDL